MEVFIGYFIRIGIVIASFLFLLLAAKRNNSRPDKILIAWIGLSVVHQVLFYFDYSGFSFQYPHLLGLRFPLPILHGILLFFYVKALTENHPSDWKKMRNLFG